MYNKVVKAYTDLCDRRDAMLCNLCECHVLVEGLDGMPLLPASPFLSIRVTVSGLQSERATEGDRSRSPRRALS